jgi:hypothetical protein
MANVSEKGLPEWVSLAEVKEQKTSADTRCVVASLFPYKLPSGLHVEQIWRPKSQVFQDHVFYLVRSLVPEKEVRMYTDRINNSAENSCMYVWNVIYPYDGSFRLVAETIYPMRTNATLLQNGKQPVLCARFYCPHNASLRPEHAMWIPASSATPEELRKYLGARLGYDELVSLIP